MKNTVRKIIRILTVPALVLIMAACSSLTESEEEVSTTNSASGYYRGHYGLSGWDASVSDKSYTKNYPVFTGNRTE